MYMLMYMSILLAHISDRLASFLACYLSTQELCQAKTTALPLLEPSFSSG